MKGKVVGVLWILGSLVLPVMASIFFLEWTETAGWVFAIVMMLLTLGFATLSIVHAIKTHFTKW